MEIVPVACSLTKKKMLVELTVAKALITLQVIIKDEDLLDIRVEGYEVYLFRTA